MKYLILIFLIGCAPPRKPVPNNERHDFGKWKDCGTYEAQAVLGNGIGNRMEQRRYCKNCGLALSSKSTIQNITINERCSMPEVTP